MAIRQSHTGMSSTSRRPKREPYLQTVSAGAVDGSGTKQTDGQIGNVTEDAHAVAQVTGTGFANFLLRIALALRIYGAVMDTYVYIRRSAAKSKWHCIVTAQWMNTHNDG